MAVGLDGGLDIEGLGGLLLLDADDLCVHHGLGLVELLSREALKNLEFLCGLADDGAQGGRDLDAHHAGTGNSDTEGVLDNVGGKLKVDAGRHHVELLGRERNRESDGDGLGATLGGADILL